jgi:hypothetical protein
MRNRLVKSELANVDGNLSKQTDFEEKTRATTKKLQHLAVDDQLALHLWQPSFARLYMHIGDNFSASHNAGYVYTSGWDPVFHAGENHEKGVFSALFFE